MNDDGDPLGAFRALIVVVLVYALIFVLYRMGEIIFSLF